jgi:hypothetical protein
MAKRIERRPGRRPHKLGERKDNTTAKLEEAVVAYREALCVLSQFPLRRRGHCRYVQPRLRAIAAEFPSR